MSLTLLHALLLASAAGTSAPASTRLTIDTLAVDRPAIDGNAIVAMDSARLRLAPDTGASPRRRAIVYSDAYATRLTIHRYASYTMLPLFAAQYVLGDRLLTQKSDLFSGRRQIAVDAGLRRTHAIVAGGVATLFVVNTTTGLWNLFEARRDPNARGLRTTHALLMLAADAGFTLVGIMGARATDHTPDDARRHRNVALGSMGIATGGAAIMWLAGRR